MIEISLKEIVMVLSVMGGTALIYSIGTTIRNNMQEETVGERLGNSMGIFSGSVLFGILVCLPLSGYLFDKIHEPKIEGSPKKVALIKGCMDAVKELNENGIYPKDVNCTELVNNSDINSSVRTFKQHIGLRLLTQHAKERHNR
jgi:hypothetical protein